MNNIFEAAASMAEPETLIVIDNDDDDDNDNSSSSSGSGDGGRNPARGENNNINNNEETETPDQTPSPPLFTPASQKKARKEGPVAARSSGGHEEGVANEKDQDGPIKYSLVRDSGVGMCSICYCPFDEEEHVMSCLRCGHIFGKPCIIKWLGSKKGNEKVCPICKARAGPSQVMTLYAPQLTEPSVPPDENENRKLRLQLIEAKRQNYLIYQTIEKLKRDAEEANERYEKLKAQVVHDRLFSGSSRSGGSERVYRRTVPDDDVWCPPDPKRGKSAGSVERPALESRFEVSAAFGAVHTELTNNGRVVEYYPQENVLFYSTEFPNKKYGVVMHSLMDTGFKAPMKLYHTGTIRDVAAGGDGGTLITASSDKTVKLCSIKTRNEIVECHTPSDVWSCCWDANDPRYFYCGRQDGEVCMYDCRKLNSFVCSAHPPAKTQIHSLCSLRMPDGEVGLIVGSVKGISYMHGTRAKIEDAGWVQEEKCIGISGLHESFGQTFIAASFRGEAETTHRIYVVEPRMTYRKNARGILEQASEFKNNVFSTLMAKPGLVSGQNGQMFLVTNNGLTPELILWSPDDDGKPAVIKSSLSAKSYVRHPALSITSFEKDKTPYFVTSSKNEVVIYGGLT